MSDSDSDVPLAQLAARKKQKLSQQSESEEEEESSSSSSSSEAEFEDDDDDDFEDEASSSEEEDDGDFEDEEESSDEDDIPLARLKSPTKKSPKKKPAAAKKKKASAKKPPAKKKTAAKTKTKTKKKSTTKKTTLRKSSSTVSTKSSANRPNLPSFALYDTVDKGLLIQRILCRWWYATTWPDPAALPSTTPKGHDELNGFPGVYVCSKGVHIGQLLDKRDKSTAPCFANYVRKSAEELRGMLLKAIAEQKRQLVEAEGSGTETEKELNSMEKWARKLNCAKVDREAEKALKAARIRL